MKVPRARTAIFEGTPSGILVLVTTIIGTVEAILSKNGTCHSRKTMEVARERSFVRASVTEDQLSSVCVRELVSGLVFEVERHLSGVDWSLTPLVLGH